MNMLLTLVWIAVWLSGLGVLGLFGAWLYMLRKTRDLPARADVGLSGAQREYTAPNTIAQRPQEMRGDFYNAEARQRTVGTLTIITETPQRTVELKAGECIIGRVLSPKHNVMIGLSERSVSGRHAHFTARNGQYYLRDTSTNGTYVMRQGKEIPLPTGQDFQLYDGDVVRFGMVVRTTFNLPDARR